VAEAGEKWVVKEGKREDRPKMVKAVLGAGKTNITNSPGD